MKKTNVFSGKRVLDMLVFKRILRMKNDNKKSFYGLRGCGLEIEFGVDYQMVSSRYIKTGLEKIKGVVGDKGKFVTDITVSHDFNVEIVTNPLPKDELKDLLFNIINVLDYYENFVFDENCGVHATFLAYNDEKRLFYDALVAGGYDSDRFSHNKYKCDFLDIIKRTPDGNVMTFDMYMNYQNNVSGKYTGVNFLKENLIEFRSLDLNWPDIEYVIDLYESVISSALVV
jgi:AAA+ ATPase superfamily predicted ATPase